MNKEDIIVIFKEIGKSPVLKRIQNSIKAFEEILGGAIDSISYEDIFIICKKERENLRPNVYLNIIFGKIDSSIRGSLFIVNKDDEKFKSLTKAQILKYSSFLIRESFNYAYFDKNGKYISKKEFNKMQKENKKIGISKTLNDDVDNETKEKETLAMILQMQAILLQFIKNNFN